MEYNRTKYNTMALRLRKNSASQISNSDEYMKFYITCLCTIKYNASRFYSIVQSPKSGILKTSANSNFGIFRILHHLLFS